MSTDYTPIGPVPSGIANGTVDATSRQLARDMRGKAYGKDVRETIARMTEWHSIRSSAAEVLAAQSAASVKKSEKLMYEGIRDITTEYALLRPQAITAIAKADAADVLSKSVQSQFNQVVIEGDSSVEAAQARVDASGHTSATLKERLDKEHNEVTTQLAQTQSKPMGLTHRNPALFDTSLDKKGLISFVSDDACIEDYTIYKPLFDEYGWVFSMAIQTSYMGGLDKFGHQIMTWEQFREMNNQGYTALAHTHTHPRLADLPIEEAEQEMAISQRILLEKGFEARHLMYPHGSTNNAVQKIANKYFLSSANIISELNTSATNKASVNRYSILHNDLNILKNAVDRAISEEKWLVFYFHGYEATENTGFLDKLKSLLDYVNSKQIDVVSYDDGYDWFIRKIPTDENFGVFNITNSLTIPNHEPHYDFEIASFGWRDVTDENTMRLDSVNKRIEVNDTGIFLIEYSLMVEVEENAQVTSMLFVQGINSEGNLMTKIKRSESFRQDGGIKNIVFGTPKPIDLRGQSVIKFRPSIYKGFNVYLTLAIRGQSGEETNKIVSVGDASHLSITKIG